MSWARIHLIPQAIFEIRALVKALHVKADKMAKGQDDLKAALADNAAAITESLNAIDAKVKELVAAATGDNDDDIEGLAQQLTAETAQLRLGVANTLNPPQPPVEGNGGAGAPVDGAAKSA